MIEARTTPLAWLNLTHSPLRLAASLAGVTFAVVLIFMELGFWNALLDSTVAIFGALNLDDNDIVLVSRAKYTLASRGSFNRRRLEEARAFPGVEAAYPLYIEARAGVWRSHAGGRALAIRVLAFNPDEPVFRASVIGGKAEALKRPQTALIDEKSRKDFGPRVAGVTAELARREVHVVGTFHLGTDFANNGNLIMSDRNFLLFFPDRRLREQALRRVDVGLVKVARGVDSAALAAAMNRLMGTDVAAYTTPEFRAKEQGFWRVHTPVGTIFGMGLVMGFIVGVVICYQILYSEIHTHIAEFATLKAMGYPNRALVKIVFLEAVYLSLLGFAPGLLIAWILYEQLRASTGLPMSLMSSGFGGLGRVAFVAAVTLLMCLGSALLAIRKLFSTDPAGLFK